MRRNRLLWLSILGFFVLVALAFYIFDGARFFSLAQLKESSVALTGFVRDRYVASVAVYLAFFITVIAFSLPVTGPLTLLGGFLFGVVGGVLFSTIGATIGATIAFLLVRRGVGEVTQTKYGARLKGFKKKLKKHGHWYLLLMNFSTMFPYAIINVVASLAGVSVFTVAWTTGLGFMPSALVYTFAGNRLSTITSMSDVFSPGVIAAFVLLMLLTLIPLIIRWAKGGKI